MINTLFPKIDLPPETLTKPLVNTHDVASLVKSHLEKQNEFLLCISLDGDSKPISMRIVSIGARNQATLSVPDIMRSVIFDGATGMIFVHNHPSGMAKHSNKDIDAIETLKDASKILGLTFVDSIVVCSNGYHSISSETEKEKSKEVQRKPLMVALKAIEEIGTLMMPVGLVTISLAVLIIYLGAATNGSVDQASSVITLISIYPISWAAKTISGLAQIIFEALP
jgi:hypothetical protein